MDNKSGKFLKDIKFTRRNVDRWQKTLIRRIRNFFASGWDNLRLVRRAVIMWLSLVCVLLVAGLLQSLALTNEVQTNALISGGTYAEGVVDRINTINPLYAESSTEIAASRLIYRPLFTYDETGRLRGILASSWSVSEDGKTYSVKLRDGVKWTDGEKFTADDVVFTMNLIKNPVVDSPLLPIWSNVEIAKVNDLEIKFTLRDSNSSFQHMLNFGVLPEHILRDVKPEETRSFMADDSVKVVGTGMFKFAGMESGEQTILKFSGIEKRTRLQSLMIRAYANETDLVEGFKNREINAATNLSTTNAVELLKSGDAQLVQAPIRNGMFALFNNSTGVTSDKTIREALRLAVDRNEIRQLLTNEIKIGDETVEIDAPRPLETPIATGIIQTVDELSQPEFNLEAAATKLDEAGWKLNDQNQRIKDGQILELNIVAPAVRLSTRNDKSTAEILSDMWQKLGVKVNLKIISESDTFTRDYLVPRNYDVLVYQLNLSSNPDVSAYWLSIAANESGLNFANYKSRISDLFLTTARSETNTNKRSARYTDFAKQWINDVPAIALYQPNIYNVTRSGIESLSKYHLLNNLADRFFDINNWTAVTGQVYQTP